VLVDILNQSYLDPAARTSRFIYMNSPNIHAFA